MSVGSRLEVGMVLGVLLFARPLEAGSGALYYTGGLGTPIGVGGVEGVKRFTPSFELSGGAGIGMLAAGDKRSGVGDILQWSLMPRLLLGDAPDRVTTLGAGISGGGFGYAQGCNIVDIIACNYTVQYVIWANAEVGREIWSEGGGMAFRYFVGYAHGFAENHSYNIPYIGFSVGYAFVP